MFNQITSKTSYSRVLLPPALGLVLISLMWLGLTGLVKAAGPPGTVNAYTKIADNTGGFNVTLTDVDQFGNALTPIGDLNKDGIPDLAVGAWTDDTGGAGSTADRGAVYILFMKADGTVLSHTKIADNTGGLGPLPDGDSFGSAVMVVGDLNGDGVSDLAVGAFGDDTGGLDRGAVYILFMKADGTVLSHTKIANNTGGFGTLANSDRFGLGVTSVGDLNKDKVIDLAVSAFRDDTGGAGPTADRGAVYVLFMKSDGTVLSHTKIADNTGGFNVTLADSDGFGHSVTGVGDLNLDGVPDLAVGTWADDTGGAGPTADRGAVYVLFMKSDGTVLSHTKIAQNSGGFNSALTDGDLFGAGLAAVGDLNLDGIPDLAVGAMGDDTGGTDRGAIHVLFLKSDGTVLTHTKIADNTGGFNVTLTDVDLFGRSLTAVGDLNQDGVSDWAVGALWDDTGGPDRGAVYILLMNGYPVPAQVTFSASPTSIPADGKTTSTISAIAQTTGGNPLPGQTITFTTNLGTLNPLTAVTNGSGVATTTLSAATPGTATVVGTAAGGAFGQVEVAVAAAAPPGYSLYLPLVIKP